MHIEDGAISDHVYANYNVKPARSGREITDCNTSRIQSSELTGNYGVKISSSAAVVCLVLLCVLLLTAVIVLCVIFTQERQQLQTIITNPTEERDQLLINNTNLIQLNLQFNQEKYELLKFIQDGWIYYQFSLFYISNEKKNWTESRRYCTERGADLVIIENSQKQDLVKKISCGSDVWIGLTDSEVEGTWKWVDNSTLNSSSGFWKPGEPNGRVRDREEDCAMSRSTGLADFPCSDVFKWICEKKVKT